MSDPAREAIVQAVSAAVGRGQPPRSDPDTGPSQVAWLPADGDWEAAAASLQALGDELLVIKSRQELAAALGEITARHQVKRAVRWDHRLLRRLDIDRLLAEQSVDCAAIAGEQDLRSLAAEAELGITALDALVVSTGTLVMRGGRGRERAVSLLPEVHLALVTPDRRLRAIKDLAPLWQQWRDEPGGPPGTVTLVTGHSRTADIELILVSGVHGPKYIYVFALEFPWDD